MSPKVSLKSKQRLDKSLYLCERIERVLRLGGCSLLLWLREGVEGIRSGLRRLLGCFGLREVELTIEDDRDINKTKPLFTSS